MKHTRPATMMIPLLIGVLQACSSAPSTITQGQKYPAPIHHAQTLDIQVFRHATEIEFTNTTAHEFGPSTLWLNGRFSHPIDGLALGQTLKIPLKSFKDEFGEAFRGGGFWAIQRPERLALAELQNGNDMLGLIVVGNEEP